MVSNSTQTFIIQMFDYQVDYNIKLITFILLVVYVFFIWYSIKRIEIDALYKLFYLLFARVFVYSTIFFLPLFTIMLFREYAAITMWTLMMSFYSIVFVGTALVGIMYGWNKLLGLFKIPADFGLIKDKSAEIKENSI